MCKRLTGFFVAMIAIIIVPISVQASLLPELSQGSRGENQNIIAGIETLLGEMMSESELTGFDFEGNLELGTRFNAYRFGYRLEAIEDIHWYPVLENGSVVAIVSLHGDFHAPAITLRKEFAPTLQGFIERTNDAFALLFEGKIFI